MCLCDCRHEENGLLLAVVVCKCSYLGLQQSVSAWHAFAAVIVFSNNTHYELPPFPTPSGKREEGKDEPGQLGLLLLIQLSTYMVHHVKGQCHRLSSYVNDLCTQMSCRPLAKGLHCFWYVHCFTYLALSRTLPCPMVENSSTCMSVGPGVCLLRPLGKSIDWVLLHPHGC